MLEKLDEVNWGRLSHAYGKATDIPDLIRSLASNNSKIRKQAMKKLYGNIFHQGSRYRATPYAVPFLYELLEEPTVNDKHELIMYLVYLAIGYPESFLIVEPNVKEWQKLYKTMKEQRKKGEISASEDWSKEISIDVKSYKAVLKGISKLYHFLDVDDEKIKINAIFVLAWFKEAAVSSLEKIRSLFSKEKNSYILSNALISAARLAAFIGDVSDKTFFESLLIEKEKPLVRASAAISLVTILGEKVNSNVIEELVKAFSILISKKRIEFENVGSKLPWNDGNFIGYVAYMLSICSKEKLDYVLPSFCQAIPKLNGTKSIDVVDATLRLTFHNKVPKGKLWTLEELDDNQLMILRILANNEKPWQYDDGGIDFYDFTEMIERWKLPSKFNKMKEFIKSNK